jgi:hypothetical protein
MAKATGLAAATKREREEIMIINVLPQCRPRAAGHNSTGLRRALSRR